MGMLNGVVEAVAGTGKSIKVGPEWYGAFNSSQLNGCTKGDEVEFEFVEKGQYKNIKGGVTVRGKGASSSGSAEPSKKVYSKGSFPIDALDGQRSIVRQNALTNACNICMCAQSNADLTNNDGDFDADKTATTIINLARKFEAYTAGDLDRLKAMELANKLNEDN